MGTNSTKIVNNHTAAAIVAGGPAAGLPPSTCSDLLLAPPEAGAFIGGAEHPINVLTLCDWRCRGTGPAYIKCGRLIRYKMSDLTAWLEQGRVVPGRG